MSILSDNILTLRKHMGLTGEKFAKKFGVKLNALQSYERDRVKNPAPLFIAALTEHFGISASQIFKEKITSEQLGKKTKPSEYSIVHVKLEAAQQRIKDLEYTIKLQERLIGKK
jgi:transcriptional regulator with XRE-family HTH domain